MGKNSRNQSNSHALTHLSRIVRKPSFCICEKEEADQLRGDGEADQRLFMPPTLKKWGAYCFRLVRQFVRLFVRPSVQKKFKARV